jgi:hypothetical protein
MQTPTKNREDDGTYMVTERTQISPPQVFDYRNVCFWEPESRRLIKLKQDGSKEAATLLSKAKKFLENNCIKRISQQKWHCLPLEGYNSTTYLISFIDSWDCNCQGFSNNQNCSHILAVKQYEYMEKQNES